MIAWLGSESETAQYVASNIPPTKVVEALPVQQKQAEEKQTSNKRASPTTSTPKAKGKKRKELTKDNDEQEPSSASSSKRAKATRVPRAPYSEEERAWLMSAWSSNRGERRYKDWNQVAEAFNLRFPPKEPGGERTAAGLSTSYYRSSEN